MTEGVMASVESETDKDKQDGTVSNETNTTSALVMQDMAAAAGFNIKSPILNAVIQNLTQVSSEQTEGENSQGKRCPVCDTPLASDSDKINHILGKRHKNRLWSLRIIQNINQVCKIKTLMDPTKGEYMCPLCKLIANSPMQLVSHMRGKRHTNIKTKTGIVLTVNRIDDLSRPVVTYFCKHCEIYINSHKKMLQHKASFIHQIHVERNKRVRNALRSYW